MFLPDRLWKLKFQDTVDTYFVYMMLVSSAYKEKITSMASGTSGSMYNIPKETFLNLQLVIPAKIDEQKQLGKILKKIDTLITLHQRKLEKLVQIRKAFAERCFLQSRKEFVMAFTKEADFEEAVVKLLIERGWKDGVLKNYTEQQLIQNWANILFENNRGIDRLNDYPLTDGEMQQIMEQVMNAKTPMKLNKFINGKSVLIKRDNPDDKLNFGKEVSLKIYDRLEIAAGLSRYQIAEQPKFPTKSKILNDRRGDLMLLINGMPVIHMELKKSGVSIKRACNQIEKYAAEGIFTGLFSLVQIFVAMNPEETVYFANPGPEGQFNKSYYFHWADFYNEPMNDWKDVTTALLSIPMAHMLVGFYTVADGSDGILKVMRSYQYYAASKISDAVSKAKWENDQQRGGYIWHTTGSGKTMTSFKSAQLIASSKDADKVIFLMDRIELGTQSLKEYRNFAGENEEVQATENTDVLVDKLKSTSPSDTLIVTSIQKMSNIKDDAQNKLNPNDIALINAKRLVFIVDECHRSTFGDMMQTIKHTFPKALFFGFTGTPIQGENQKKMSTTATVFGNELHRYSIADGIRDHNVLGFDPYKVLTFKDSDLRKAVALEKAKAYSVDEALADPQKSKVFYKYLNLPMAGGKDALGEEIKGIEDYIPNTQYEGEEHQKAVVEDICENWQTQSRNSKFHQQLLNDYAVGHERQTTMDFHHQLKGAIMDAVDDGLIVKDPTRKAIIKGKPPVPKKVKYLNQFELHLLLSDLDLQGKLNWDWMILLIAKTGIRFSEALAITPADFDFAHQMLSINKTWDYKGNGGFLPTKNKSSVRKIQIDWQTVIQFAALVKDVPEDKPIFVFKEHAYNSTVNDVLERHCDRAKIPVISVHGLRHTHASVLLFAGVSIASVARRLGHSSMTTTQKTYLHIIQELENQDIDLVMRSLSGLS